MSQAPRYRILLVEDDSDARLVLAMLLNEKGYDISTAANGIEALSLLEMEAPDMIISDLNMPDLTGFELLSIVRDRWPSIPVVAMSASHYFGGRLPDGVMADAFYAKGRAPFEELFQKVAELFHTPVVQRPTTVKNRLSSERDAEPNSDERPT